MRNRFVAGLAVAILLLTPAATLARGGGSSGGGSRSSSSSSSSKSSGGSKSSTSGSSSKSYSNGKTPTASKPSTGSKSQRPVAKILPPALPRVPTITTRSGTSRPLVSVPAGRSYSADRAKVQRPYKYQGNRYYYTDPYGPRYYGYYSDNNPFFYMWLFSVMDNDRSNNALPPESPEGLIAPIAPSYFAVAQAVAEAVNENE